MKVTDKMSRAICQVEKMYNTINTDIFQGELPIPIITVQSKPGSMGHSTVAKIWRKPGEERTYELNIAAEVLDYPIEETLDTIIHEMVHLYCREHDIKECSRNGVYHNKKFKEEAEKRDHTKNRKSSTGRGYLTPVSLYRGTGGLPANFSRA